MRRCLPTITTLSALVSWATALTITQPDRNTVINPQQDFTIRWTSNPEDPQTLTFTITGAGDFSILQYQEIASNIQTSAGSTLVPANTLGTYGQYKIEARDASTSSILSTSPAFYLAQGDDQTVSITQNPDTGASRTITITGASGSDTMSSGNPQISFISGADGDSIVLSGTRTTTTTVTSITTRMSDVGGGGTEPSPTASQTTTTRSTPNAQIRIGGGEHPGLILSIASMLAGLVAWLA